MGAQNNCEGRWKVPTMSKALSSIQWICFRKTSGSNMGAPNLFLAPGAIWPRYAPANRASSYAKKISFTQNENISGSALFKNFGPKIWPDIHENLKSLSPYSFGNQYKNTSFYLANIPVDFCFICLSHLCNIFFSAPLFPYIFYLFTCSPHPQHIGMLSPLWLLLLLFCLLILSDVDSMHFVTFLLLFGETSSK